jgi:predicted XRE-type DNA-binding protein
MNLPAGRSLAGRDHCADPRVKSRVTRACNDGLLRDSLARELRGLMQKRGLGQIAAAAEIGIPQPALCTALTGVRSRYSWANILKMLVLLGADVNISVKTGKKRPGRFTLEIATSGKPQVIELVMPENGHEAGGITASPGPAGAVR